MNYIGIFLSVLLIGVPQVLGIITYIRQTFNNICEFTLYIYWGGLVHTRYFSEISPGGAPIWRTILDAGNQTWTSHVTANAIPTVLSF